VDHRSVPLRNLDFHSDMGLQEPGFVRSADIHFLLQNLARCFKGRKQNLTLQPQWKLIELAYQPL
jgi:hypothetical protein